LEKHGKDFGRDHMAAYFFWLHAAGKTCHSAK